MPNGPVRARPLKENLSCQISFRPKNFYSLVKADSTDNDKDSRTPFPRDPLTFGVQVTGFPVAVLTHWFNFMTALVVRSL